MNPIERKRLRLAVVLGLGLTAAVMLTHVAGLLRPLNRFLYDARARVCQYFTPPPTPTLLHVDIDDNSLDSIGRWPWHRSVMASIIEELERAGARLVALDILSVDPQEPRPEIGPDGEPTGRIIHDDERLGEAIATAHTVVSAKFDWPPAPEAERPVYQAVRQELLADLEQPWQSVYERLSEQPAWADRTGLRERVQQVFVPARRDVLRDKLRTLLAENPDRTEEELAAELLPQATARNVHSPAWRVLSRELVKARSAAIVRRALPPLDSEAELPRRVLDLVPIPEVSGSASGIGFFDYFADRDDVSRFMPLWIDFEGKRVPQFGLLMACRMIGVDPADAIIKPSQVILPQPDREPVVIPTRKAWVGEDRDRVAGVMDIPWFGPRQWHRMYDRPGDERVGNQHLPITSVWEVADLRRRIAANLQPAGDAIRLLARVLPVDATEFDPSRVPEDDLQQLATMAQRLVKVFREEGWVEAYRQVPKEQLDDTQLGVLNAYQTLSTVTRVNQTLRQQLDERSARLREQVAGNAALIGWTATAAIADFVPTSLHGRCPGVVVHGVVYNAIMTEHFWWRAPMWLNVLAILVAGLLSTWISAVRAPFWAISLVVLMGITWVVLNGVVLFDYADMLVAMGGPLVVMALVWAGSTLLRFVVERRERNRITRSFRTYVDPALVSYVLENPEKVKLEGQVRTMSVVFTDLGNFTTISERMGYATVGILNEYLRRMVPLIESNRGFINKFLGDGIMFFFNAPYDNPRHAFDALETVLQMQAALADFNQWLVERDLPQVKQRAGITTGEMIVGDAGYVDAPLEERRSDYTVLGDVVNTAARLESANKATDTLNMIDERTAKRLGDQYLLRPLGKLQVVGKAESLAVFEPMGHVRDVSEKQRDYVSRTTAMVEAFWRADFAACLDAADHLEAGFGPSKLIALYRNLSHGYQQTPPPEGFDGSIELTSK